MSKIETFSYDNKIVRDFGIATTIWGIVGMLVGLLAALQLIWPEFNITQYFRVGVAYRHCHSIGVDYIWYQYVWYHPQT